MIQIRASSLATLFDCPARWEAVHIQHRRTPTTAKDGVLTTHTNRDIVFEPEPLLIEPWPVELERVA